MAGVIGTVSTNKIGLMPALTKSIHLRNDSTGGILLLRLNGQYSGGAIFFTTVGSRGYVVGLYALTANVSSNTPTIVKVRQLIGGQTESNTKVKYVKEGDVLDVYLVRESLTLTIGAEVIYNDGISAFLENVDSIPANAVDATYVE